MPQISRAGEYAWDEDLLTVEEVWPYVEPDAGFTFSMGEGCSLESGNTLVAWSSLDYLSDVTPDGEVVWLLRMDEDPRRDDRFTAALTAPRRGGPQQGDRSASV